jgi:hypothetical protein
MQPSAPQQTAVQPAPAAAPQAEIASQTDPTYYPQDAHQY